MGYTVITANQLKDISGEPLNGRVEFTGPVDNTGAPVSVVANGGPVLFTRKKFLVVNGAIIGDENGQSQVTDVTVGNPTNFGYTVEFFDKQRGKIPRPGYQCVQPFGDLWSLDNFVATQQPSLTTLTVSQSGIEPFSFVQVAPSATWSIPHNLGRTPSVSVIDSSGNVCLGAVQHNSVNQLTISFGAAFSGSAYLV